MKICTQCKTIGENDAAKFCRNCGGVMTDINKHRHNRHNKTIKMYVVMHIVIIIAVGLIMLIINAVNENRPNKIVSVFEYDNQLFISKVEGYGNEEIIYKMSLSGDSYIEFAKEIHIPAKWFSKDYSQMIRKGKMYVNDIGILLDLQNGSFSKSNRIYNGVYSNGRIYNYNYDNAVSYFDPFTEETGILPISLPAEMRIEDIYTKGDYLYLSLVDRDNYDATILPRDIAVYSFKQGAIEYMRKDYNCSVSDNNYDAWWTGAVRLGLSAYEASVADWLYLCCVWGWYEQLEIENPMSLIYKSYGYDTQGSPGYYRKSISYNDEGWPEDNVSRIITLNNCSFSYLQNSKIYAWSDKNIYIYNIRTEKMTKYSPAETPETGYVVEEILPDSYSHNEDNEPIYNLE